MADATVNTTTQHFMNASSYNNPNTQKSTQMQGTNALEATQAIIRKMALIKQQDYMLFSKMADYTTIPSNQGTKVVYYYYPPLIDSRNLAMQGLDQLGNQIDHGNLFGSSFDIAERAESMPFLAEIGGNANQVNLTVSMISGTFSKYGMFMMYTGDNVNFSVDTQLYDTMYSKLTEAFVKVKEIQILNDIICNAGTIFFAGSDPSASPATTINDMTAANTVSYFDFQNMSTLLTSAGAPKKVQLYAGSPNFGTTSIPNARYAFAHPAVINFIATLKDPFGGPAFTDYNKYAGAISTYKYNNETDARTPFERGAIGDTRLVEVDYMPRFTANSKFAISDPKNPYAGQQAKVDVYPIVFVSNESFTILGYEGNTKGTGFIVSEQKPTPGRNYPGDMYNDVGSISIKWFYGFMALRPELIGIIWTTLPTDQQFATTAGNNAKADVDMNKVMTAIDKLVNMQLPARGAAPNVQDVNMYPAGGSAQTTSDEANKNPTPDNPFAIGSKFSTEGAQAYETASAAKDAVTRKNIDDIAATMAQVKPKKTVQSTPKNNK